MSPLHDRVAVVTGTTNVIPHHDLDAVTTEM
jgi:hypothetical protein